jgi:formylglycine-generating enzyme required for sulfatase activity
LTIGISGRWGSGKTTLLRRVQRMLEQTETLYDESKPAILDFCNNEENPQEQFRPCRTVWFNAWKYADEEQLLVALIRVIVQEMSEDDIFSKVLAKLLDPSYPRRDVVNTVLGWFSINLGDMGIKFGTGEAKETPFAEKTAMLDLFDDALNKLMAAWVHHSLDINKIQQETGVLVVLVDDLDRCLPSKVISVLEAIKLFFDKHGCVFVLAADTNYINSALQEHFSASASPSTYLEKIINLRFELPPATYATMQEFFENEKMIGEEWGDSWRLLMSGATINPRGIKTFVNDLNLRWAMFVNSVQVQDVNRSDFNTWQVLARIAPRNFLDQIRERLEDNDLRYKFLMDAIAWARGDESLNDTFRQYDSWRLKRVLRNLTFGDRFNSQMLAAFVYLTTPGQLEESVEDKLMEKGAVISPELEEVPVESGFPKQTSLIQGDKLEKAQTRSGIEIFTFADIPFVRIPVGKFLMGSKDDNELASLYERPWHTVELPEFYITRFPVTNELYLKFTDATGYVTFAENEGGENPEMGGFKKGFNWRTPLGRDDNIGRKPDHPVVQITWQDAIAFVRWLNETSGNELLPGNHFVLPTEAQWEKAARGEYGNEWPWGNEFDKTRCNSRESEKGETTSVDTYPAGASPYGVMDMVGNVWEWTHTLNKEYPYTPDDGRESEEVAGRRILRGGSFNRDISFTRCASRGNNVPDTRGYALGFRVCVSPIS